MARHVISESKRCLKCKNARCTSSCPVNTPIAEFIDLYLQGRIKEAGELLFKNNPLSVITSLVCPHSEFCEGSCIRGIKGTPIEIGDIEHYVSDYYLTYLRKKSPSSISGR